MLSFTVKMTLGNVLNVGWFLCFAIDLGGFSRGKFWFVVSHIGYVNGICVAVRELTTTTRL